MRLDNSVLDLKHFKARLLARRSELEAVAATGAEASATVELDQSRVGRLSRMDALQGQAMAQATSARRQLEMQRIASALSRIDDHTFGDCVRCGDAIAIARLEVDPAATLCIDCAESTASKGTGS